MGLKVHGDVGKGKQGVLSEDQLLELLLENDERPETKNMKTHYKTAINKLLTSDESDSSGGGNSKYPYDGLPLYHESSGVKRNEGATIFYVKRNGVAEIVGLGYHTGAQTYDLTWRKGDWMKAVKRLTFDKQSKNKTGPQVGKQKVPKGKW